MINHDKGPHIISDLKANVTIQELSEKIKASNKHTDILKTAEKMILRVKGLCHPKAVYQWFEFHPHKNGKGFVTLKNKNRLKFNFGDSIRFLEEASYVLIATYTIGKALDKKASIVSGQKDLLKAYLIDLIGLVALEQAGKALKGIAEHQARLLKWGVGPFLSPGSVHGWCLSEQARLCGLLPLNEIDVMISKEGILSPFKTVSCLIGIGAGYKTAKAGTTCQVCSINARCQLRKILTSDKK